MITTTQWQKYRKINDKTSTYYKQIKIIMEKEFINLKDYADAIMENGGTKKTFLRKMMEECNVSMNTAFSYTMLDSKPSKQSIYTKLSKMTGIPEADLFRRH